ncbi:MAG: LysM peptidoglycan-binding domain-containing protein [Bacillota bacterium]|nr:LysM peptidoglycan-binding domain-containing protein [Bacillota bacterium]MDW7684692.1 LysM peptidoglycan-binding domain-containing protein [Bacillota bacterium]
MIKNQPERVRRILPLLLAEGTKEVGFPLVWSLPGSIQEYDEPELTVLDAKATALVDEICVTVEIQQSTHYIVNDSGLVDKETSVHRLTKMIAVQGVKPGDHVNVTVEPKLTGGWRTALLADRNHPATEFTGDCRLTMKYTVSEDQEIIVFKPVGLDGEIMADTVEVESLQARFTDTFDLSLPVEFEHVPHSIAQLSGKLTNLKTNALCGWIKVEGDLCVNVTYLDQNGAAKAERFVYPKKVFVEVAGASSNMSAEAAGDVQLLTCVHDPGAQGGLLRGVLHLTGRLLRVEALDVAGSSRSHQSFYHGKPHHSQGNNPYLLEEVIAAGSSQTLIQREIFFGRMARRVREPVDAEVRNLTHEVIPNKVIVRGILHKQLYVIDAETGVVFAHDVDESFVHFVDVPGASPGMRVHARARVEFVKVDIHPDGETARQVTIVEVIVKVTRVVKKHIAVYPVTSPSMPLQPSEKVYIVRSGDSIWKIARMFGVSMDAIIAANNLQNPNMIFPGQKLKIPR